MNILVLSTQVPFSFGGAELLVSSLCEELKKRGHNVDTIRLPSGHTEKKLILEEILLWRNLRLDKFGGKEIDLVIPTKFPSYLVNHPNKVIWLFHQFRQAYDLYGTRFKEYLPNTYDETLREMINSADNLAFSEAKKIFTISNNVSKRLKTYNDFDSEVLLPPCPYLLSHHEGKKGDYLLIVGRICSIKRVDLLVKAMPFVSPNLKLKIVGSNDEFVIYNQILKDIETHDLSNRVELLGNVSKEELIKLYADCFAVVYVPYDEDFGFVTHEAISSKKPLVTTNDSGAVLDFIQHGYNGIVCNPDEKSLAEGINKLQLDEKLYATLVEGTRHTKIPKDWDYLISTMLSDTLLSK